MPTQKRCRCGRLMRRQFDDLFHCKCGTSWSAGKGFFVRTNDMTVETKRIKVGNQVKEQHIVISRPEAKKVNDTLPTVHTSSKKVAFMESEDQTAQNPQRIDYEKAPSSNIVRGGIYYIQDGVTEGSEIMSNRPALVVSEERMAYGGKTATVIFLTSREIVPDVTRVPIQSCGDRSFALCDTVTTLDIKKIGTFVAMASTKEMMLVKRGLAALFGFHMESTTI